MNTLPSTQKPSLAKQRLVLLTDSLGCPRKEVSVEETWVDQFINRFGTHYAIYTQCKHGLSTRRIDFEYLREIKPDFVVAQIGIVDACRRAYPYSMRQVLDHVPRPLSKPFQRFASAHHYALTRSFQFHTNDLNHFAQAIQTVRSIAKKGALFVSISPPGPFMKSKTYAIESDVMAYNNTIESHCGERFCFIEPYSKDPKEFLLDDGHHLNAIGQKMVLNSVVDALAKIDPTLR